MARPSQSKIVVAVLAGTIAAATGCAFEADDSIVPPGTPTSARDKLESSTTLAELQPGARLELTSRVGTDAEPTRVDMQIDEGYVVVSAERDGSLVFTSLDVTIADVVLGEAGGPIEGLHLTGLRGRLAEPVALATTWLDGDQEGFATGPISLLLDWSILTDSGGTTALATQRIDDIDVQLRVLLTADGDLAVETLAVRAGVFWTWTQQVQLSDLSIEASAVEL